MNRPRVSALILATSLVLAASGCSGSPDPAPASASPTSSPIAVPSAPETPSVIPSPSPSVEPAGRADYITGLAAPWDIEFAPDGSLLVTLRDEMQIVRYRDGVPTVLTGPGVDAIHDNADPIGEAGLLGMVLDPEDPTQLFTYASKKGENVVYRMTLDGDTLTDPVIILAGIPQTHYHDGGRLAFGPDGFLYVTTGDAGVPERSQDTGSLGGKILRITRDGEPAPGNPFDNAVWSYGHRNVQGLAWDAQGRLFASEFGQNSFDEVNLIVPGANYGWPQREGMLGGPDGTPLGATLDGLTYPVAIWPTSDASPSGVAIQGDWLYVAALRGQRVWRLPITAEGVGEAEAIIDDLGRMREVAFGPDGALYAVTNNTDGRLEPREGDDRVVRMTFGPEE